MIEPARDASQVADAVAARVHETPRVDLVDDPALPPEASIRSVGHQLSTSNRATGKLRSRSLAGNNASPSRSSTAPFSPVSMLRYVAPARSPGRRKSVPAQALGAGMSEPSSFTSLAQRRGATTIAASLP